MSETRAPRDVHDAAVLAVAESIRQAVGYGSAVRVDVPQVAPAVDVAYELGVAAGRRRAAEAIRQVHDTWERLGKLPQSYLDGVADAAGIVEYEGSTE